MLKTKNLNKNYLINAEMYSNEIDWLDFFKVLRNDVFCAKEDLTLSSISENIKKNMQNEVNQFSQIKKTFEGGNV